MNRAYRIKTWIRRKVFKAYFDNFATSYPLLSAYGFRSIAHFTFDQFSDFDPSIVEEGQIIYVKNDLLERYFMNIHPLVKAPYILLTHGDDFTLDDSDRYRIIASDEKIIHWYSSNLNFIHEGLTLLPLGLENFRAGTPYNFINSYRKFWSGAGELLAHKSPKIIFGFTLNKANTEREDAYKTLTSMNIAEEINLPRAEYYNTLAQAQFIACPRGNGIDCHRIWEALYLNTIPVLIRSSFSTHLEQAGFPVLIVEKWSDLKDFTSDSLHHFYEENKAKFKESSEKLYLNYWLQKIR